jgi:predicted DNA-binding protein YlxM (UPF0122 family)
MAAFHWDKRATAAAELLAAGNLSVSEIAAELKVSRQTIWAWRKDEQFQARVAKSLEEFRADVRRIGIADQLKRVASQNDRWNRLRRVIDARAADPSMAKVPGGDTGLLVRTTRGIGSGDAMVLVEEYAVDTGLLKSLLEHERQAAQELGQLVEKSESSVAMTCPITIVEVPGGFSPPAAPDA